VTLPLSAWIACRDCGASLLPDTPAQRRCLPCVHALQTDLLGRRREDLD
jgi:hypothetical protein